MKWWLLHEDTTSSSMQVSLIQRFLLSLFLRVRDFFCHCTNLRWVNFKCTGRDFEHAAEEDISQSLKKTYKKIMFIEFHAHMEKKWPLFFTSQTCPLKHTIRNDSTLLWKGGLGSDCFVSKKKEFIFKLN